LQFISVDKYQKGSSIFPDDETDPSKKDASWHLQFAEAIYSEYLKDKTVVEYSTRESYSEFRAYGAGRQSVETYKKRLSHNEQEGRRKGLLNIDWSTVPIILKYKSVIQGMFETVEHDIVCDATDKVSGDEKQDKKYYDFYRKIINDQFKEVEKQMGFMEPLEKEDDFDTPDTLRELDLYEQLGSFKLKLELAVERMANHVMLKDSNWSVLRRKLINDLLDIGLMATKTYVDPISQKIKTRYVDPEYLTIQKSKHSDFFDSDYAAEPYLVSIQDIRATEQFTDEELKQIVKVNIGFNSNPRYPHDYNDDNVRDHNNTKVLVYDCEMRSIDRKYKLKRTNKRGETYYFDQNYGEHIDKPNKKTITKDTRVVRKVKWIVGTKLVYDWGLQNDVPRPAMSEPMLSIQAYAVAGKGFVERCIPFIDGYQLTWLRMQNAIATSRNAGMAIEWSALDNISLGGKILKPKELLAIRRDQGDLIWKMTSQSGRYFNNGVKPFQEIEGGMGRQLNEFMQLFTYFRGEIAEITGVTPQAAATEPRAAVGLGVSEMAVQATSNAIKELIFAYTKLKEYTATSIGLRSQILLGHSPQARKHYEPVIGYTATEIIKISKDVSLRQLGISLRVRPQEIEKQNIRNAAQQALQVGRDGQPTITMSDYILVERMLQAGDLRMAEAKLASLINKRKQESEQHSQQMMQQQQQGNMQLKQADMEIHKAKIQMETEAAIQIETLKAEKQKEILILKRELESGKQDKDQAFSLVEKSLDQELKNNEI